MTIFLIVALLFGLLFALRVLWKHNRALSELENAAKRGGVAGIQVAVPGPGPLADQVNIGGTMKPLQLLASCGTSATAQDPTVHAAIV